MSNNTGHYRFDPYGSKGITPPDRETSSVPSEDLIYARKSEIDVLRARIKQLESAMREIAMDTQTGEFAHNRAMLALTSAKQTGEIAVAEQGAPSADEIVKSLREAKAVRLMIAEQDNIEAYTGDLDNIISRLEVKEAPGDA